MPIGPLIDILVGSGAVAVIVVLLSHAEWVLFSEKRIQKVQNDGAAAFYAYHHQTAPGGSSTIEPGAPGAVEEQTARRDVETLARETLKRELYDRVQLESHIRQFGYGFVVLLTSKAIDPDEDVDPAQCYRVLIDAGRFFERSSQPGLADKLTEELIPLVAPVGLSEAEEDSLNRWEKSGSSSVELRRKNQEIYHRLADLYRRFHLMRKASEPGTDDRRLLAQLRAERDHLRTPQRDRADEYYDELNAVLEQRKHKIDLKLDQYRELLSSMDFEADETLEEE